MSAMAVDLLDMPVSDGCSAGGWRTKSRGVTYRRRWGEKAKCWRAVC